MSEPTVPRPADNTSDVIPSYEQATQPAPEDAPKLFIAKIRRQAPQHIAVLICDRSDPYAYYYAEAFQPIFHLSEVTTWKASPRPIELTRLHPLYNSQNMTRISDALIPPGSFQKRLEYLRYSDQLFQGSLPAKITAREIRYNEYLAANSHPNLYKYYGVTEDLGFVMSLVLKKYSCDLQKFVDNCRKYDVKDVFTQLSGAVEHIHRLGLVHVDIKPENVFVDEESDPVKFLSGDFDSMHAEGEKRNRKWATKGWADEEMSSKGIAVKEMDWYGLNKIKGWLMEKEATRKGREETQKKIEAFKEKEAWKAERGTKRKLDGG